MIKLKKKMNDKVYMNVTYINDDESVSYNSVSKIKNKENVRNIEFYGDIYDKLPDFKCPNLNKLICVDACIINIKLDSLYNLEYIKCSMCSIKISRYVICLNYNIYIVIIMS